MELDLPVRSKKRSKVKTFELSEVFWKICLEGQNSSSYLEEIQNLPSWDSPDIFLDSDADSDDLYSASDETYDIFETIIPIFETVIVSDKTDCEGSKPVTPKFRNEQKIFSQQPTSKGSEPWNEFLKFGSSWDDNDVELAENKVSQWSTEELQSIVDQMETVNINAIEQTTEVLKFEEILPEYEVDCAVWTKCSKFGSTWETYFALYETNVPDKNFTWTSAKILSVIVDLESFDISKGNFLQEIVTEDEPEDIFEINKHIFEEEPEKDDDDIKDDWNDNHKFGKSWDYIILDSVGFEWNNSHMFGSLWVNFISEIEESSRLQLKKQTRKRKVKQDFDLSEVFWKISCRNVGRKTNKFLYELQNLPSWDSPDVFLDDDEENIEEKCNTRKEEELDIFESIKHIFDHDNVNQDEIIKISETEEIVFSNPSRRHTLTKRFRHSFRKKMSKLKISQKQFSESSHENKSFKNVIHRFFRKFYLQKKHRI